MNIIEHANRWIAVKRGAEEQTGALKISASGHTRPKRAQTSGAASGNGSAAASGRAPAAPRTAGVAGTAATAIDAITGAVTNRYYLPFGAARTAPTQASTWPDAGHGFLNAPTDPDSGLTHLGARDYDAALGRFSSVDPVLNLSDPASSNGYAYSGNNPTSTSDPTGLFRPADGGDEVDCNHLGSFASCSDAKMTMDYDDSFDTPDGVGWSMSYDQFAKQAAGGGTNWGSPKDGAAGVIHGLDSLIALLPTPVMLPCGLRCVTNPLEGNRTAADVLNQAVDDNLHPNKKSIAYQAGYLAGASAPALVTGGAAEAAPALEAAEGAAEAGADGAAAVGRDAAESCLNSFTADTPITLADGTKKPIKDVKVGDKVIATDPETGQTKAEPVVLLIRHSGKHTMVLISLADGSILDSTDAHPIWDATTTKFTDASKLHVGDKIETDGGALLAVAGLAPYSADLTAYNLQIDQIHTYYAGTTPVLVHNSCASAADSLNDRSALKGLYA